MHEVKIKAVYNVKILTSFLPKYKIKLIIKFFVVEKHKLLNILKQKLTHIS